MFHPSCRWFGGKKVTHETDDLELRSKLLEEWNDGDGSLPRYPKRSDWSVEVLRNGPALIVGGGFDLVLSARSQWRIVNVEYSRAWMGNADLIQPQNALRVTTSAVLRVGTW